jgi:hypothetical protein
VGEHRRDLVEIPLNARFDVYHSIASLLTVMQNYQIDDPNVHQLRVMIRRVEQHLC